MEGPVFWDKSPFLGRCPGLVRAPWAFHARPGAGAAPPRGGIGRGLGGVGAAGVGTALLTLPGSPPRGEEVPGEMGRGLGGVWAVGLSGVGGEGVRGGWKNRGNTGWGWNIRGRGSLGFFGTPRMGRGVGIWGALFWGSRVLGGGVLRSTEPYPLIFGSHISGVVGVHWGALTWGLPSVTSPSLPSSGGLWRISVCSGLCVC